MCFDILKQFVSELERYYNASQTDLFVLSFFFFFFKSKHGMNMKLGRRHNKELALKWLRLYRSCGMKGEMGTKF